MKAYNHISMALNLVTSTLTNLCFLLIIITTFSPQHSHSQSQPNYSICKEKFYNCGNITNISYPFWGKDRPTHCGGGDLFYLTCNNNDKTTAISIGTQNFKVLDINATNSTIKMQRPDSVDDVCSPGFVSTNLSPNLFRFPSTVRNMSIFFDCQFEDYGLPFVCARETKAFCYNGSQSQLLEKYGGELKSCRRSIQVPTDRRLVVGNFNIVIAEELERGLREGFRVNYTVNGNCVKCLGRDGNCGTGSDDHESIDKFVKASCYYCPDGSIASSNKHCSKKGRKQNFTVVSIDTSTYTIEMNRTDQVHEVCSRAFEDTNLSPNLFQFPSTVQTMSIFFDCPFGGDPELSYVCGNAICYAGSQSQLLEKNGGEQKRCRRSIQVPTDHRLVVGNFDIVSVGELERGLKAGFGVSYNVNEKCVKCLGRDGDCGSEDIDEFVKSSCYYNYNCPDGSIATSSTLCSYHKKIAEPWNWKRKLAIGLASAVLGTLAVITGIYLYKSRKNRYATSHIQSRSLYSDPSSKDPEKGSQPFATSQNFGVQHFTYAELEKATDFFDSTKKLGEGGFGTVYFGKLNDGRCVAVKLLFENNYRNVKQFKNEVEILARLFHPNLVSLYGCTSRHSHRLLLVYEYISNGTVADHLHGKQAQPGRLPWHIRMNIAVEIASALKYLHLSDIIHRDIKTNNILLDSHFRVKVADFGLSRLFPIDCTHVSTAPQGTPGYVDPEYHECYQLTDKSDVYSFGVVLFQLISSLPAVDITRHKHEINLANMAVNKIQNQALHELVDPSLGFESDLKVGNMITAVAELAFQCVQCPKQLRPSMKQVLETLEGIREGTWKFNQIT